MQTLKRELDRHGDDKRRILEEIDDNDSVNLSALNESLEVSHLLENAYQDQPSLLGAQEGCGITQAPV